ncbi:MAG: iron ABC transporter permease [Pseudomonadota bacterium]
MIRLLSPYVVIWPGLLVLTCLVSLKTGVTGASWADVLNSLSGDPSEQGHIIATYRLPRVIAGVIVGIHFALAGIIMQVVLRNPLADPTIFGISSGASLAVVCAMSVSIALFQADGALSVSTDYLPLIWIPYIAFAGAVCATVLVLLLALDRRTGLSFSPGKMVLSGIILGAMLNALVMVLVLSLSEARTELAILWLSGTLYARGLSHVWPIIPWTLAGLAGLLVLGGALNLLRCDPQTAQSLGVSLKWERLGLILVALLLAASAVSVSGPIGFVGLLVPHFARLFVPHSFSRQIWVAVYAGAILVVASDTAGRMIAVPIEVPVGVITGLIGAPAFAFLIRRQTKVS